MLFLHLRPLLSLVVAMLHLGCTLTFKKRHASWWPISALKKRDVLLGQGYPVWVIGVPRLIALPQGTEPCGVAATSTKNLLRLGFLSGFFEGTPSYPIGWSAQMCNFRAVDQAIYNLLIS